MSQVPKNRKHSARATAMLPSHSRHGEPQGRWGSRAGHGWAAPAPRTRFLEWRQERRECSGDVNADIHGPCQARSRHGCSQQLTWGRSRGGGAGRGRKGGWGPWHNGPFPSAFEAAAKLRVGCCKGPGEMPAPRAALAGFALEVRPGRNSPSAGMAAARHRENHYSLERTWCGGTGTG